MNTRLDPRALAIDLCFRSACRTRMAAVLVDRAGAVFAWGWNHAGPLGFGTHAEEHALNRANRKRVPHATIYVVGIKHGTVPRSAHRFVYARPCEERCLPLLRRAGVGRVWYVTPTGVWRTFTLK